MFAESDMIHKQQTGQCLEDIICGLCQALVRNYLNNIAKGKTLEEPIIFQGGVAANIGIVAAFEKELNAKLIVPEHYDVMGALGAAIISKGQYEKKGYTSFAGFDIINYSYSTKSSNVKTAQTAVRSLSYVPRRGLARWGIGAACIASQEKDRPAI